MYFPGWAMASEELVKDFMGSLDRCYYIKEEETVREALQLMDKAGKTGKSLCLIVVEEGPREKQVIKGFVTSRELVFGLTTHFLKGAEKSGPIFWEGQFEAECRDGMNKRVKEIMSPVMAYVRDSEMLMEAVFLLHKYQQDFLLAINKEEEVVGIIDLDEILKQISKIALSQGSEETPGKRAKEEDFL
jgi:CBS-domain-containing membrane protein